jgi:hypothetical protein
MKANYPTKTFARSTNPQRFSLAGFSRRMARPSIGQTVSSLNSALRTDMLWDGSWLDRLQAPVTRRPY